MVELEDLLLEQVLPVEQVLEVLVVEVELLK